MQILVLANSESKSGLLHRGVMEGVEVEWLQSVGEIADHPQAHAVIDLLFEKDPARIQALQTFLPRPVLVNSVIATISELDGSFVRINGWPHFLAAELVEAAGADAQRSEAEAVLAGLNRRVEWLPDDAGFVTPRVISAIINEAYLSLEEGVSTEEAIDTAMKLGTNYPYGPFEWARRIGTQKIHSLLSTLAEHNPRYKPAESLTREASV